MTIDELRNIDNWSPDQYKQYYEHLIPSYQRWYNTSDGYRPVVMGLNIPYLLNKGDLSRVKKNGCKNYKEEHEHPLTAFDGKQAGWRCPYNKSNSNVQGGWNRYRVFGSILWTIEDLVKNPDILKTVRSMYYYPISIYNNLKQKNWSKSWIEVAALNAVVDIDITDKKEKDIYKVEDKWGHSRYDVSFDMLSKIANQLDDNDINYIIQSSGNGWYINLGKISILRDNIPENENLFSDNDEQTLIENKDGTTELVIIRKEEAFWNVVADSIKEIKKELLQPIVQKYAKFFNPQMIEEPYTNQFFKTPNSLHQRLDYAAKPTNLDEINSNTSKEFKELCSPTAILSIDPRDLFKPWSI